MLNGQVLHSVSVIKSMGMNFPGIESSLARICGDEFSGDEFSLSDCKLLRGRIFRGRIFPAWIFPGTNFRGRIFPGTNFRGRIFPLPIPSYKCSVSKFMISILKSQKIFWKFNKSTKEQNARQRTWCTLTGKLIFQTVFLAPISRISYEIATAYLCKDMTPLFPIKSFTKSEVEALQGQQISLLLSTLSFWLLCTVLAPASPGKYFVLNKIW